MSWCKFTLKLFEGPSRHHTGQQGFHSSFEIMGSILAATCSFFTNLKTQKNFSLSSSKKTVVIIILDLRRKINGDSDFAKQLAEEKSTSVIVL